MDHFHALVASENPDGTYCLQRMERAIADLPAGEVLIRVQYSSLNYKDALSATGNRGVTRRYPHTPGIDATGIVVESQVESFRVGDDVVVTGFDLGMNTSGGFAQYIRVPAAWVLHRPPDLSGFDSMAYGTAGLTATLCIDALQRHGLTPDQGTVIVTGATGGVGSLAIALLAKLGYTVIAVSGKPEHYEWLRNLGATEVVGREMVNDTSGKPLLNGLYAGAIDTVGGNVLATILKHLSYGGAVAACGLVGSPDLPTTVYPFILRGVSLLGIDSAQCELSRRLTLWQRLAGDWSLPDLGAIAREIPLSELPEQISLMLAGQHIGRTVINLMDD